MSYPKKIKSIAIVAAILLLVGSFVVIGTRLDPTMIVEGLGVNNTMLVLFIVSFFGGFSTGGSAVFITVLITAVAGGLNPWLAGAIAGTSLFIGDTIMFLLAEKGRRFIKGPYDVRLKRIQKWLSQSALARALTPLVVYVYIGFSPLPNDLIIMFLAAIKYPKKLTILILFLGDYSFSTFIAVVAAYGMSLI
jgi:membrane protein YqaA with SNARE-associated domain